MKRNISEKITLKVKKKLKISKEHNTAVLLTSPRPWH